MARAGLGDPVAAFIAALDARLSGPAAAKADLLAEARDGLHDAADAHAAAGHPDPRGRAVAEFGDLDRVAADYQAELGAVAGIRTLRSVVLAIPVMHAIWMTNQLVWIGSWEEWGRGPVPEWYGVLATVQDRVGWVVLAVLGVALLAGKVAARRGADTRRLGRAAGYFAAAGATVLLVNLVGLLAATASLDVDRLLMPLPCLAAGAAMFVVHGRLLVLAHRSLRCTALRAA